MQALLTLQLSDLLDIDAISEYERLAPLAVSVSSFFRLQIIYKLIRDMLFLLALLDTLLSLLELTAQVTKLPCQINLLVHQPLARRSFFLKLLLL